jgi:hypothetical protein
MPKLATIVALWSTLILWYTSIRLRYILYRSAYFHSIFIKFIGITKTGLLSKRRRELKEFILFGEHSSVLFSAGVYLGAYTVMLANMDISTQ